MTERNNVLGSPRLSLTPVEVANKPYADRRFLPVRSPWCFTAVMIWGMGQDEENARDYEAKLYVGDLEIASMAEQIPPELLSVFTDGMFRTRTLAEVTPLPGTMPGGSASEFAAPGPVIADRLDALGFTPARVRVTLDGVLDETRKMAELVHEYLPSESKTANDTKRSLLAGYTANDWIAELRAATGGSAAQSRTEPRSADWLMSLITDADRLIVLRAALLACPDHEVRLDVTWHYAGGTIETIDGLCSSALDSMHAGASGYAPVVVLAEGRTDIEFLGSGLRLLCPHLVDLIRFMDFAHRPAGGAASLVTTVKSFAAAGIANRVVALFDNDTAAADALRPWDRSGLPASIRVFQYPPLSLATDYPTLGPPPGDTKVANTDVNGLAGSIELYLGRDVLTDDDGNLRPVHWHAYIQSMRRYQGEIADKNAVQDAYRAKVRDASADRSRMAQQDWSGVSSILDMVIHAFD